MDTPASHKTTPYIYIYIYISFPLTDWQTGPPATPSKKCLFIHKGWSLYIKPVSVLVKYGEMRLWYPVPLRTSAFPSVPCICDRSLWHRKTLLASAMSLALPSSHLQTPQLPETRSWQHQESTRFLGKPTKQWEICLFSVFWGVFFKRNSGKGAVRLVFSKALLAESGCSGASAQQPAKEPGGVPQRPPQDELMEDLIESQFKGSGRSQSEISVRVSQKRRNFYRCSSSHLRH